MILLALIVILLIGFFLYSYLSTESVKACNGCPEYNVSVSYPDKQDAAMLLHTVSERVDDILDCLEAKYLMQGKNDHERYGLSRQDIVTGLQNIRNRFSPTRIREINPDNLMGYTSYTEGKNDLVLCLRHKTGPMKGQLYDYNTIMFVVLHEVAHMMNNNWGHTPHYWNLFSFLLKNAHDCGYYTPVDYGVHPIDYCGMEIKNNPYYFV